MIVYAYRLAPPEDEAERDLFFSLIRYAHRYRNTLVSIERSRRVAVRAVTEELHPELARLTARLREANTQVENAVGAMRKERAKNRKRTDTEAIRETVKVARQTVKQARTDLKEARAVAANDPQLRAQLDVIGERALELVRSAREYSGLARRGLHYSAWGTYLLVEDAAKTSFAKIALYAPDGGPSDPKFIPWKSEGTIGIQITGGGVSVETAANGAHRLLKVTLPDPRCWEPGRARTLRRSERDALARQASVSLFACTNEDATARYVTCRMHMHRPIPKEAHIRRVSIERVNVGHGGRWTLLLTIDAPQAKSIAPTLGGAVAVDIGWRVIGDGLRVCGWADDYGRSGELRLDAETIRRLREPENTRSARDGARERMQARVGTWLSRHGKLPDWIANEAKYFRLWRAPWKLLRLLKTWRDRRFEGDAEGFDSLEAWAGNERWMHTQESDWRSRALARRSEIFRNFAVQLARQYDTIVLEDFDLRRIARLAAPESEGENLLARSNRQLACVHGLRLSILDSASKYGRIAVKVPAADTTRTCPVCGLVEDRHAAESIRLACDCGAAWDQDVSGAPIVMLASWRERPGDAKTVRGTRDGEKPKNGAQLPETRRDRVTRKRKEKLARMQAAREAGWI